MDELFADLEAVVRANPGLTLIELDCYSVVEEKNYLGFLDSLMHTKLETLRLSMFRLGN